MYDVHVQKKAPFIMHTHMVRMDAAHRWPTCTSHVTEDYVTAHNYGVYVIRALVGCSCSQNKC